MRQARGRGRGGKRGCNTLGKEAFYKKLFLRQGGSFHFDQSGAVGQKIREASKSITHTAALWPWGVSMGTARIFQLRLFSKISSLWQRKKSSLEKQKSGGGLRCASSTLVTCELRTFPDEWRKEEGSWVVLLWLWATSSGKGFASKMLSDRTDGQMKRKRQTLEQMISYRQTPSRGGGGGGGGYLSSSVYYLM